MDLGLNAPLGFRPFPGSLWNQDASSFPTDPNSDAIIAAMPATGLLIDREIPYLVVDGRTQPWVKVQITTAPAHSDGCIDGYCLAPLPPSDEWTQKGQNAGALDFHAICIDRATLISYEMEGANLDPVTHQWSARILRTFNLCAGDSYSQHGFGPSAKGAGCSWMAGLLTFEEATQDGIFHALSINLAPGNFPAADNHQWYLQPASFPLAANKNSPPSNPLAVAGCGTRFVLKSNFVLPPGLSKVQTNIIAALKTYGCIPTDRGGSFYADATGDPRWATVQADLAALRKLLTPSKFRVCATQPRCYYE